MQVLRAGLSPVTFTQKFHDLYHQKEFTMIISVNLGEKSYDITLERGALGRIGEVVGRGRRVCVVTDDGVPASTVQKAIDALEQNGIGTLTYTFPQGEESKSFDTYLALQKTLLDAHFTRKDAVVAVGGGVVGDLAGFAAATYMRGIDFYNVPTTVLSQVDSSIGGKTAVDFAGYKNMIGAFHQPRAVLIDPDVLLTLPRRQAANGLAEALKMGLTSDATLFSLFENETILPPAPAGRENATVADIADRTTMTLLERVIARAITVKRDVVQEDEKETGLRRVLNFGHTLGHAVESCLGLSELYHGECVAVGMAPMCGAQIRDRVVAALQRLGLPTALPDGVKIGRDALIEAIKHDKKAGKSTVTAVLCDEIGSFRFVDMTAEELVARM
ncbi:MAG: 3-dehydroquinate synthase [Clostridia bacterium]|nr:3-dehydroquinate synthase [Clostridia bacterium]